MNAIYKISSIKNPEIFYIGATVNYKKRVYEHSKSLNTKTHKNRLLQMHCDTYSIDDLQFSILELVDSRESLPKREQFYIDSLNPTLNICRVVGSSLGVKRSDEYRAKMSLSKKGKKHRPECNIEKSIRQKGRKRAKGFTHTEEAKRKIKLNNKKRREIIQYDLFNNLIKEWHSISEASEYLGICKVSIGVCCMGRTKTSGGYKWKYKN